MSFLRKHFCFQSLKAYISNWKHYVESQAENADLLDFKVKDLKTREAGFMFSKFLAFILDIVIVVEAFYFLKMWPYFSQITNFQSTWF